LPPHLSPFYEYDEEGIARLKLKKSKETEEDLEEEVVNKNKDENTELREMMISKNKKKILNKIREEKMKKKRNNKPKTDK
jgi:hypothetical protein